MLPCNRLLGLVVVEVASGIEVRPDGGSGPVDRGGRSMRCFITFCRFLRVNPGNSGVVVETCRCADPSHRRACRPDLLHRRRTFCNSRTPRTDGTRDAAPIGAVAAAG